MIDLERVKKYSPKKGFMGDVDPEELSLVGRPANKQEYLLTKSERENQMNLEAILKSVDPDNEQELVDGLEAEGVTGDALEAVKAINRLALAFDEVDEDVLAKAFGIEREPVDTDDNTDDADIRKSDLEGLPENVRNRVESVLQKNEDLEERVDGLAKSIAQREDERRLETYKSEVEGLENLNTTADELAEMVKSVADQDEDIAGKLLTILRSANEVAGEGAGDLYKSTGSGGDGPARVPSSVEEAGVVLEKRARDYMQKSDNDISLSDAMEHILRTDPEMQRTYFN